MMRTCSACLQARLLAPPCFWWHLYTGEADVQAIPSSMTTTPSKRLKNHPLEEGEFPRTFVTLHLLVQVSMVINASCTAILYHVCTQSLKAPECELLADAPRSDVCMFSSLLPSGVSQVRAKPA